jgi:plastocyanin
MIAWQPCLRNIGAIVVAALALPTVAAAPPRMMRPAMPSMMGSPPAAMQMPRPGPFQLNPNNFPSYMMPYGMRSYGGYGSGMSMYAMPMSGGGYGGGFGRGYGSGAQPQSSEATPEQPSTEEQTISRILSAVGLPNDRGRLNWPVGLRILPNPRTPDLRQQIDALLEEAAEQSSAEPVNARLNQELVLAVDSLRKLLLQDREERFSLPATTYENAEAFLTKLKHAQELLSGGLESPAGQAQLKTEKKTAEVGVYDNRFNPLTLTVSVGTTVHWTNQGEHKHTVTSDKGDWTSKELAPGAGYSYTFSKAGTCTYHCEIHATEMRGRVVVK